MRCETIGEFLNGFDCFVGWRQGFYFHTCFTLFKISK